MLDRTIQEATERPFALPIIPLIERVRPMPRVVGIGLSDGMSHGWAYSPARSKRLLVQRPQPMATKTTSPALKPDSEPSSEAASVTSRPTLTL